MFEPPDTTVVFRSYTYALRHPVVIGQVAGWRLPWAVSATQLAAVGGAGAGMLATRPLWAHLGGMANLVVFCLVLATVGWAARRWRIEGRSPARFAAGLLTATLMGRRGVRNGVAVRPPRPVRGVFAAVVVAESKR
jgi:hypothetical protein